MESDEVFVRVTIPWTRRLEFVKEFKQAHRRDDDIALVNAGMRLLLAPRNGRLHVEQACLVFGGVGATVVVAVNTAAALEGQPFTEELVKVCVYCCRCSSVGERQCMCLHSVILFSKLIKTFFRYFDPINVIL